MCGKGGCAMRLGWKIASRFLKSNKGQTILIILGIAIGVSVQIFIGSLIQGLQKGLIEKTIGNSSQITVLPDNEEKTILDYEEIVTQLLEVDSRIKYVSPVNDHAAFLSFEEESQSILLRGFDLEKADQIYDFSNQMVEGKLPENKNEIILGTSVKETYGLSVGDEVTITTVEQKEELCKVVGFFDLKVASINDNWGIASLATSESIFDTKDTVTSIEMQVNASDVFAADEVATIIENKYQSKDIMVENWKKQNEQLLSGLSGQSISSYMIQVFVLISVVLGIASVLAITVMQKSKQIGILKAMGLKNATTSFIFLFEGLILGVFGAIGGILLGLLLAFSFTKFALNPDGTPVIDLYISASFIAGSGCIAVLSSVFAALIPAKRSSSLNPIDIIRNN